MKENLQQQTVKSIKDWFYEIQWRPSSRPMLKTIHPAGSWIILGNSGKLASTLVQLLEQQGQTCSLLLLPPWTQSGTLTAFEQIEQQLKQPSLSPLVGIVYLWSLDTSSNEKLSAATLEKEVNDSCESLLHLMQGIAAHSQNSTAKLWVITENAVALGGKEPALAQVPLWGQGRVFDLEHSHHWGGLIDLDKETSPEQQAEAILLELLENQIEKQVTYRFGVRHVARLAKSNPSSVVRELPINNQASYLISGGLGALGMRTAQWLVEQGARHLVLLSRSGANTPEKQAAVQHLAATGVQVLTPIVDISQAEDLTRALQKLPETLPPIRGIVHAAGIYGGKYSIDELEDSVLQETMQPKVGGSWNLHQVSLEWELDFFVNFSSLVAVFGTKGQSHYAAANEFQNQFAAYRRAQGLPAHTVNWTVITGAGMFSQQENSAEAFELLAKIGMGCLTLTQMTESLGFLLRTQAVQTIVAPIDWERFGAVYMWDCQRPLLEELTHQERPELLQQQDLTQPSQRREEILVRLRVLLGSLLEIPPDEVATHRSLLEMGVDSIVLQETVQKLEATFGIKLTIRQLFEEINTLDALATHIISHSREELYPVEETVETVDVKERPELWQQDITQPSQQREQILVRLRVLLGSLLEIPPDEVATHRSLLEMGVDSIVLQETVQKLEATFGIKLTIRQLFEEINTLDALATHIITKIREELEPVDLTVDPVDVTGKTSLPSEADSFNQAVVPNKKLGSKGLGSTEAIKQELSQQSSYASDSTMTGAGTTAVERIMDQQLQTMAKIMMEQLSVLKAQGRGSEVQQALKPDLLVKRPEQRIATTPHSRTAPAAPKHAQTKTDLEGNADQIKTTKYKEFRERIDFGVAPETVSANILSLNSLREICQESQKQGDIQSDLVKLSASLDTGSIQIPLSEAQKQLWILAQISEAGSIAYHVNVNLDLRGQLKLDCLEQAVGQLVKRHEALRTIIDPQGEWQRILSSYTPEVQMIDYSADFAAAGSNRQARLVNWLSQRNSSPFDLTSNPLFRVEVLKLAPERHIVVLVAHHMVVDGWSMENIMREIGVLYSALCDGAVSSLESPLQFREFLAWQRQQAQTPAMAGHGAFWLAELATVTAALDLPTDKIRPTRGTYRGSRQQLKWEPMFCQQLRSFSQAQGCTLFMTLLAGYLLLIHRLTGQREIVVGIPTNGRSLIGSQSMVGYAAHILPIRSVLGEEGITAQDFLANLRRTLLNAYEHQDYPFAELLKQLNRSMEDSRPPLVSAILNMEPPTPTIQMENLEILMAPRPLDFIHYDLEFNVIDFKTHLLLDANYRQDLFQDATISSWLGHLSTVLKAIVDNPQQDVATLPLLTEQERYQMLVEWNDTNADYPQNQCIHQLFEAQAESAPDAVALVFDEEKLTYQQLNEQANQLAHYLQSLGVGPKVLVGICLERSVKMVVGLLGILKAGAAYVPIDPIYPAERITYILADTQVSVLLTQDPQATALSTYQARVICLDIDANSIAQQPRSNPKSNVQSANLAYVIYTSGSTGHPKGVQIVHQAVVNFLTGMARELELTPADTFSAITTISFDIAILEIFGPLSVGAKVVVIPRSIAMDGERLLMTITAVGTTVMQATPVTWQMLLQAGWTDEPRACKVLCGGETLSRSLATQLLQSSQEVWNLYGPTEATIWTTLYRFTRQSPNFAESSVPIGRPIINTQTYILDGAMEPVPINVMGELHIGGIQVARGYLNRPELTAEKFIPNPFGEGCLYKTGDKARYRADGNIEFLGRLDNQVKIRGFRIEIGEIEVALAGHQQVRSTVVIAREEQPGDKRLVAYIVPEQTAPDSAELREFLKEKLPDYMVPTAFVMLETIPVTSNGKIDRKALPLPSDEDLICKTDFMAPQTPSQKLIASLFAEVLSLPTAQIGIYDNFFELGGHSLLAMKLVSRVRDKFEVNLPLRMLFESPTVVELDALLKKTDNESYFKLNSSLDLPTIEPTPEALSVPFPLNEIQQAYWLGRDASFELGNVATHGYLEIDCHGLDLSRLGRALQRLIDHHAMLRAIVLPDGQQQILAEVPSYEIAVTDLSALDSEAQLHQLMKIRNELSHQVLPVDRPPLFQIGATVLGAEQIRLHISFDALIADAASSELLSQQLMHLYHQSEANLSPLKLSFRDYVLAEKALHTSEWYKQAERYWFDRLDSLPTAPELPLAVHPSQIEHPRFQRRSHSLSPDHWQALQARGQQAGLTPSGILLAAFSEVLSLWSRRPHFTLNLTTFNRLPLHPEVDEIVGDFTSLTLLEVDFRQPLPFIERARALQKQLFEDLDRRQCNGMRVLREFARRHRNERQTAMPVVFTSTLGLTQASGISSIGALDKIGNMVYGISQTPQVWLDHIVFENQGKLLFNWDTIEGIFPAGMLDDMFAAYCDWLERLAVEEMAWQQVRREHLLSIGQQQQRSEVNATQGPVSKALLHGLFIQQLPDRARQPAVITPDRCLSYSELAHLARLLAHQLRLLGAEPNALVAVVLEKGWQQVVAVLGVLMSGAAYVPIDPHLPPQRQMQLIEQSQVHLAIASGYQPETLAQCDSLQVLILDEAIAQPDGTLVSLDWVQKPEDLAYVIYTSGSTGTPKGVAIDHRGAVNTLLDINGRFTVSPQDSVLALSALNFDLSVYDIFGVLAAGGTLVMPDAAQVKEPAHWIELMRQHRVTLWNTVPALAQMLVDYLNVEGMEPPGELRLALLSGDWLPLGLPEQLRHLWPEMLVISLGGATEASIWSIAYPIKAIDPSWSSIPYGQPLANQSFAVLNEQLEHCPVWVPGELHIGGIGLAKGYWLDVARTTASFIAHPITGERLYKTGDLGRYLPDGNIEFLGREDFQVKIRGFRIELGEIESVLNEHPTVKQTVVTTIGESPSQQLVAYIVPNKEPTSGSQAEAYNPGQLPGVILDPAERIEFKLKQPGLRRIESHQSIELPKPPLDETLQQRYLERQSYRQFKTTPLYRETLEQLLSDLTTRSGMENLMTTESATLSKETLSHILSAVMALPIEGALLPKYRYPSAGSLYPVQVYVRVAAGAIADVEPGIYYYHPVDHVLVEVETKSSGKSLAEENHSGIEFFLVGHLPAIEPMYGELAKEFCILEAGYMSEVIRETAAEKHLSLWPLPRSHSAMKDLGLQDDQYLLQRYVLSPHSAPLVPWEEESKDLQIYLYLKPNHNSDLEGGLYRYHPGHKTLDIVSSKACIDSAIYGGNEAIFEQAQLSLFLVGTNLEPASGQTMHVQDRELLMAGQWGQVLMTAAPRYQVGLCPIGRVDEKQIAVSLGFDFQQRIVHSFVGGLIEAAHRQRWLAFETKPTVMRREDHFYQFLQARLPDYMIPTIFVPLETLPLTPNGKVNRKALPAPDISNQMQIAEYVAPRTSDEEKLAAIWSELLGVKQVGIHDNFFDLGGDSLQATRVIAKVREVFAIEVSLRKLFESPTIAEFSSAIEALKVSLESQVMQLSPTEDIEYEEGKL